MINKYIFNLFNKTTDGTYNSQGKRVQLRAGFQVSYFNNNIRYYSPKHIKELAKAGPLYIGVYKGVKEISANIRNKAKAVKLAQKYKQFSIGNNKTQTEIII